MKVLTFRGYFFFVLLSAVTAVFLLSLMVKEGIIGANIKLTGVFSMKGVYFKFVIVCLIILGVFAGIFALIFADTKAKSQEDAALTDEQSTADTNVDAEPKTPDITWMTFDDGREITASQYFVYSRSDGEFKVSFGDGEKVYPASVTKLFTAYVALKYLEPDDVIVVGDALQMVTPGSSVAGFEAGEEVTVATLVEAMLLPSGNDAAYILACEVGWKIGGDMHYSLAAQRFTEEMNSVAGELGMNGTNFANPDGIHHDDHYTTYKDLVIMAEVSLDNPVIAIYAKVSSEGEWKNTNSLIDPQSQYYCPIAVGLKTGQTPSAGSCLLSAFSYNDEVLIIGVFGCAEKDDRFPDTLQLLNGVLAG